ncbi:MAG: DUF1641 domain-containing protein [Oscillochloridaceae bacterium umkhey_bin13]
MSPTMMSEVGPAVPAPIDSDHLAELMSLLLQRMDRLEQRLAQAETLAGQVPGVLATAADTMDGLYRDAAHAGIDADERLKLGLVAVERLTAPENLRALTGLAEQLVLLDSLTRQAPGFMAMTVDMVDELYAAVGKQGVNLEATAKQGLMAFRNFVTLLESEEVRALIDSGVLDPKTLQVMGAAATALVCTQREPRRAGPAQLVGALFNPHIQRSLGFALGFAERFGQNLPTFPEQR